jgi:hypothetical protein
LRAATIEELTALSSGKWECMSRSIGRNQDDEALESDPDGEDRDDDKAKTLEILMRMPVRLSSEG